MKPAKRESTQKTGEKHQKISLPQKDNMGSAHVVLVLLFFFCAAFLGNTFLSIDLSLFDYLKFFLIFLVLSIAVPIKWYRKKLTLSYYEFYIFNTISIAPFLFSFFLFLNFVSTNSSTKKYKIVNATLEERKRIYTLENSALNNKEFARTFTNKELNRIFGGDTLKIQFSTGIFGITRVDEKTIY